MKIKVKKEKTVFARMVQAKILKVIFYAVLTVGALIMAFPFFWMALNSLRHSRDILENPLGIFSSSHKLTYKAHEKGVAAITVSGNGKFVLSGGNSGRIKLWDMQGKLVRAHTAHHDAVSHVAFCSDDKTFASTSGKMIKLWGTDGKQLAVLKKHNTTITGITFSAFGTYLISADKDRTICVWNVETRKFDRFIKTKFLDKQDSINCLAIDSDDEKLVLGTTNGHVWILNFESGKIFAGFSEQNKSIRQIGFSADRKYFVSTDTENIIRIRENKKNGKLLHTFKNISEQITGLAISTAGSYFATSHKDGSVRVWHGKSYKLERTFHRHLSAATCVAFSMDNKLILSGSADSNITTHKVGGKLTFSNYKQIFKFDKNFGRYIFNSIFVSLLVVLGQIVIGSLAAYGLSQIKFPGRGIIFVLIIGTMLIPAQIIVIPLFSIVNHLGFTDSYAGLVVPFLATGFSIFLFRQFFMTIPGAVIEAAVIDGCSHFQIFRKVILPLSTPVIASIGIFAFLMSWNNFFWPMMVINTRTELFTIQVGLAQLKDATGIGFLMAGTMISALPMLIAFFIAQEQFIESIAGSGTKG